MKPKPRTSSCALIFASLYIFAFSHRADAAPITFTSFDSQNSTGAAIPQTSWNNLASGVTASLLLGTTGTLDLTGPAPLAPIPGTIGLYHFDEASGATSADSSGSGNTLTLNGDIQTSALFGNGHFSQNLGYDSVTLKAASTITTIQMWFRIMSNKDYADLFALTDGTNEIDMTYIVGGYLQAASWDSTTTTLETFTTVDSYADNHWHMLALEIYPSSAAFWVDGVAEGADTSGLFVPPIKATKLDVANDFGLATAQGPPSSSLDWDDTRIMTALLTPQQIQNDFVSGNPVWVQVSTNAGTTNTVIVSTVAGSGPYLSVTSANGATSSSLTVVGLSLVQSTSATTGSGATDQLQFWATTTGSTSTSSGAIGVLVDTSAPSTVATLTGAVGAAAGTDTLTWTTPTPADVGSAGVANYYIQYSTNSGVTFSTASAQVVVSTSGVASAQKETLSVSSLLPGTTEFFALWSQDNAGNFSAVSNSTSAAVRPASPGPASPVFTAVSSFSAITDWVDGVNGSSTTYQLQASTAANFTGTLISSSTANSIATLSALAADTTYSYRVEALFAGAASTFTTLGSTSTLAALPTAISVTADFQSSVTVHWTAVVPSQGYLVLASTSAAFIGTVFSSATANGAATSLTVTGLDSGTTYFFEVGSLNWNGAPDFAASVSTKTTGVTSPQPNSPPFTNANSGSVTAQWIDESHPASNTFILQASTSSNFVTLTSSSQTALTSATISGLSINTTYYFQVEAVLNPSTSQPAFVGSTATLAVPVGSASSTYTAVFQSSFTVQFASGTAAGGFDPTGTSFNIEASIDPAFGIVNAASLGTSTTTALTGLLPGTTYFVQGQAVNYDGVPTAFTSLGSTVTAVTPPGTSSPNFPALATTSLTVEWSSGTAIFNPSGTAYLVQLATSAAFSTITASASTYNLSATLSGLTADTIYFARVQATNSLTTSAFTSLASTSTLALGPTSLSFGTVFQTSATLSWTSGGPSSGYEVDLSTAPDFSGVLVESATPNSALLTLADPGLAPNTVYYGRVGSLTSFGAENDFIGGSTVTLAAAPDVTANVSTGVAVSVGTFIFTNAAGFGTGTVDHFLIAFDQVSTHSFTGSEAQWNSGTQTENASQEGNWYFHLQSVNSSGTPGATLDFGAFVFSSSSPTGTNFESFNSFGGAVPQASWNNLASGVTSQLTVQASNGLNNGGTVAPLAPSSGTFILWHLNEGSGLVANDSSGNGNTGYLSIVQSPFWTATPTWVAGKFGNALNFVGGSGVQSTVAPPTTVQTEEFWFNMSNATAAGTIFSMRDGSQDEIIVGLNSGKLYASSFNNASGQTGTFQAANAISINTWHQGALVITPSAGANLYLDGAFAVSLSTFHASYSITSVIMGNDFGLAKSFGFLTNCSVDELRVSSPVFTAPQISADFTSGNAYYALVSTNTGNTFTTITSTNSASPPYLSITGVNGATTPQTMSIFGLNLIQSTSTATGSSGTNQVTYYATDILGHASTLGPFAILVDSSSVSAVANLTVSTFNAGTATLTWSAPTDGGLSGITKYFIEYSTNPGVVFSTAAAQVVISTSGVTAGSLQLKSIPGLSNTQDEYFALFSEDSAQNFSAISNTTQTVVVTGGPVSPVFTAVYQSSATVTWASGGGGTSYTLEVSTDPTFATGVISSSTVLAVTTATVSGLSTDGLYFMEVLAVGAGGGTTVGGSTVTLPANSSLSANVSTGVATSYGTFSFSNSAAFGFGGLDHYLVAWNNSPTYSFTGSEASWSSGTVTETASSEGSWYLHVYSLNSAGNAGPQSDLDFGPFVFSSTGPVASNFLSFNSSGTAIPQGSWNNLASGVTAQLTVQAAQGLNITGAAASAPTQDMVAYWKFDESTGTAALDSTGNGNIGTLTGGALPARVAGKFGGGLSFNGSTQQVTSTFTVTNTARTLSAWFNASAGASGYFFILQDASAHVAELGLQGGGKLTGAWPTGSFASTSTYTNSAWHNATLTLLAPTTATLYVDGALVANTTSFPAAFTPTHTELGSGYTGLLDDVFFSTLTYSPAQAQSLLVGNPFYVQYSTNTGAAFTTVTSTIPSTTTPYIVLSSTQGATASSTFTVYNLPPHHTENFSTGAAGANQVLFFFNDVNDATTQGGPFAVLVDTVAPGSVSNLSAQTGAVNGEIQLSWSPSGDDGTTLTNSSGSYLIRYSTSPISSTTAFAGATSIGSTPVPLAPGTTQTLYVEGLTPGVTYYFGLESLDKAGNLSGLSNSPSALPFAALQVLINEVFPSVSSSTSWVELVNETTASVNLNGFTLVYHQGALSSAALESTVWSGTNANLIAASTGLFVIAPSSALAGGSSYSLKLEKNGVVIDEVQWPVLPSGSSFARIYDGNPFLEINPTPTKNLLNSIFTDPTKINEVDYQSSAGQFIELYNTGSTETITAYTLRNKNGVPFTITRTIGTHGFDGVTPTSVDNNSNSFTTAFGPSGLTAAGDFLVLSNASGQTVDRVTWQSGTAYTLYNSTSASLANDAAAAAGAAPSPDSIGRQPADGSDTNVDSADFAEFATPSLGLPNSAGGAVAANTVMYPTGSSTIPRRFELNLSLGQNWTSGSVNTIWFVQTGGTPDPHSPHIFNLNALGVNLSTTSAQQTILIGATALDVDGFSLVDQAVYQILLNTTASTGRPPQIVLSNVTYDGRTHTPSAFANPPVHANAGAPSELARLVVASSSPATANPIQLNSFSIEFTSADAVTPLTTAQLQALFSSLSIALDAGLGPVANIYYPTYDATTLVSVSSPAFSLTGGVMNVSIATSAAGTIPAGGSKTFYLVGTWTPGATTASPSSIQVIFNPGTQLGIIDAPSGVAQILGSTSTLTSSTQTVVIATGPPSGTSWPTSFGTYTAAITNQLDFGNDGSTYFAGTLDGRIAALNSNGAVKWTYSSGAAVHSAPFGEDVDAVSGKNVVTFGNDNGTVTRLRDDGNAGTQLWSTTLSGSVQSTIVPDGTVANFYVATTAGTVAKLIAASGATTAGWTNPTLTGSITMSVPYDDEYTGINALWVGTQGDSLYRLQTTDGSVGASLVTGGPISGTPAVYTGFANPARDTHNLYIGSSDGKFYSRVGTNLTTVPSSWTDVNVGTPFNGSAFLNPNETPNAIYIGNDSGSLYKIDASSGGVYWTYPTRGAIRGTPLPVPASFTGLTHNWVYFGSLDGYFYAVSWTNPPTLAPGFPIYTGGPITSAPVYDSTTNTITFGGGDGKVYRIGVAP